MNFFGTGISESISGTAQADTLIGGPGDDTLRGRRGDDTYFWSRGDGNDTIEERPQDGLFDQLILEGVLPAEVTIQRNGNTALLVIADAAGGPGATLTILNAFEENFSQGLEAIQFADGTVWSKEDLLSRVVASTTVAGDDTAAVFEDGAVVIAVLGNDTSVAGGSISITNFTQPANGVVTQEGGALGYIPSADFSGVDSFVYMISDGLGGADTGTVTITVEAVNDIPEGNDDSYETPFNATLTVSASGVLTNDTDADGDVLTAAFGSGPSHGTLALSADGSFVYTPDADFSGVDSFSYQVSDRKGGSDTAGVVAQH